MRLTDESSYRPLKLLVILDYYYQIESLLGLGENSLVMTYCYRSLSSSFSVMTIAKDYTTILYHKLPRSFKMIYSKFASYRRTCY
jgi:hypothetical protein